MRPFLLKTGVTEDKVTNRGCGVGVGLGVAIAQVRTMVCNLNPRDLLL
jgi:hypothetical protein